MIYFNMKFPIDKMNGIWSNESVGCKPHKSIDVWNKSIGKIIPVGTFFPFAVNTIRKWLLFVAEIQPLHRYTSYESKHAPTGTKSIIVNRILWVAVGYIHCSLLILEPPIGLWETSPTIDWSLCMNQF